jgi:small subunit ribosomal protein S3
MGQKVNPIGFRLGINRTADSRWYADGADYGRLLHEDIAMRKAIREKLKQAGISRIIIERPHKKCLITIHTARPGLVIGKKGGDIENLRKELAKMTSDEVRVNLVEIRKPEIDASLIADDIARQLERRASFRRAMKRAIQSAMRLGAQGVKVVVSGRLGGAEIARTEKYAEGSVPLHTLRADIDYGTAEAETTYGIIGVKVWVYKGEILEHDPMAQDKRLEATGQSRARANAAQRGPASGAQTAGA